MATVFEAIDTNSDSSVALKLLMPQFSSDPVVRKRFLREARVGMELEHPGAAKVYEVGEDEGQSFMAMELLNGRTLDTLKGELSLEQCIDIGCQVADVLAAAHAKGIVHRDIKPRNIMKLNGAVKVMDFGLACVMEESSLTVRHEIVGTLCYMSPEQTMGEAIDGRSDIFSLGVVLYELLSGRLPFSGDNAGVVIHSILYSDPLRLNELLTDVPVELEQVVFKALRKRPQERYQTAQEFSSDLKKLVDSYGGKVITLIATKDVFEEIPHGIYSKLIGRDKECLLLEECLNNASQGESGIVMISGEAGIGKSRLVWEMGRKARALDMRFLIGRCLYSERGIPYQPIFGVIRAYFDIKGIKEIRQLTNFFAEKGGHLSHRVDIVKAILLMRSDKDMSLINKEQLWDTVCEIMRIMARDKPLVVFFDDLHWADRDTLEMLGYLFRHIRNERILAIGAYRPEDITEGMNGTQHPLNEILLLGKSSRISNINLTRLDKKETQEVIQEVFSDLQFPDGIESSIYKETEGNPLFILELLKLIKEEILASEEHEDGGIARNIEDLRVPDRITDVINARLGRLSKQEHDVLDIAAVDGYIFESPVISHCLEMPRLLVLRTLQNLESQHLLIHPLKRGYQFDHIKIQETVYEKLLPELKREYHDLMAEYYIECYADWDQYAGKIIRHLTSAGRDEDALPFFNRAAIYSRILFANEDALEYAKNGIEIVDGLLKEKPKQRLKKLRLELYKTSADTEQLIGKFEDAQLHYQELIEASIVVGDKKMAAEAKKGLARILFSAGEFDRASTLYEESLEIQERIQDHAGKMDTLCCIGEMLWHHGKYSTSIKRCEEAILFAKMISDESSTRKALMYIGHNYLSWGKFSKSLEYCREAIGLCKQIGDMNSEGECLHEMAIDYILLGEYDKALDCAQQGLEKFRQVGNRRWEGYCHIDMGLLHREMCEYEKALGYFSEGLAIVDSCGDFWAKARSLALLAEVFTDQGDFGKAMGNLNRSQEMCRKMGDRPALAIGLNYFAYVHHKQGGFDKALRNYEEAYKIFEETSEFHFQWKTNHFSTQLWLDMGNIELALENVKKLENSANKTESQIPKRYLSIDYGLIKTAQKKKQIDSSEIEESVEWAREHGSIGLLINGLVALAKVRSIAGNPDQAAKHALEALEIAELHKRKPDIAEIHLLIAKISDTRNNLEAAENHLKEALQLGQTMKMKPLIWQAHHALGKVHMKHNQSKKAKIAFEEAKNMVDEIMEDLSDELREVYLQNREIGGLLEDLKGSD